MVGRGLLQEHFCKTFVKISAVIYICKISAVTQEINANFHFSHYKYIYMETSCHSNESTWATTIKNTIYVEANVMNIYAIKFSDLDKIHMNGRGLLKKPVEKIATFPILSQWKL